MTSIPVLTTNVKTAAHPPSTKARKPRKHAEWNVKALPFAATHADAPTLPEIQQEAMGVFARILLADALRAKEGLDGR
ncbi:MAG: hypothetical protein H0U76_19525 [Ktedonobacteraceae bacterium]|nr:hypothetical protein [Ktedonobacteraceae bacterium]